MLALHYPGRCQVSDWKSLVRSTRISIFTCSKLVTVKFRLLGSLLSIYSTCSSWKELKAQLSRAEAQLRRLSPHAVPDSKDGWTGDETGLKWRRHAKGSLQRRWRFWRGLLGIPPEPNFHSCSVTQCSTKWNLLSPQNLCWWDGGTAVRFQFRSYLEKHFREPGGVSKIKCLKLLNGSVTTPYLPMAGLATHLQARAFDWISLWRSLFCFELACVTFANSNASRSNSSQESVSVLSAQTSNTAPIWCKDLEDLQLSELLALLPFCTSLWPFGTFTFDS